ncbi:NERD domain-containing protein [Streptomyces sp. NBC_00683]|uniref:nuclease-related domain-containing protein n=1 Tax=Streptomyces sp. NBC_00683 TaxID=2903670 RepID=UPI002E376AAA|nr:nuclease-related domain-containing protein [Streptomyces sp. NBC_00683]
MQDLKVTSWQLFGHDRLYVNLPDGTAIGWADLGSGTITVLHPRYRDAVTDALARQVPDMPALDEAAPAGPPPAPRIPPLRRMRKPDAPRPAPPDGEPGRAPDGEPEGLRVPEQGRAREPAPAPLRQAPGRQPEQPEQPVQQVPAGQPGQRASARRPVLPALTAVNDLAARRPGAALRAQLAENGPGLLVRATTGALRRSKEADPRRGALAGERRVGAELRRLTRHGWRVLHSLPLPGGAEIGHLLIGPGGVFAVRTEHRPGASVRIGDGTLQIDEGSPQTYVLEAAPGARHARTVLETHCAFAVPVRSVLVFVGVAALDVLATPPDVRVCRDRDLSALAPLKDVLTPTQVERVYDVARNRDAWPDA